MEDKKKQSHKKATGLQKAQKPQLVKVEPGKGDILQPVTFTLMRMDTSTMQNRVIIAAVNKIQSLVRDMLNRGGDVRTAIRRIKNEDVVDEKGVSIKIYLNEFGVDARNYQDLKQSIMLLAGLVVNVPYKGPTGKMFVKYTNFCNVYFEPTTPCHYCVLTLDYDIAEKLISLDMGYQMLNKVVVLNNLKNKYSQKLYTYLTMWKSSKESFIITTSELRDYLCIKNKYQSFRHVVQRVLDPAKKELKEMADKGFSDYYFDYEKVYTGTRRTGEPEKILFKIFKSKQFISKKEEKTGDILQRERFAKLIIDHFGFEQNEAMQLCKEVTMANAPECLNKLLEIEQYASKPEVLDKKAYCAKALREFFKDFYTPAEML